MQRVCLATFRHSAITTIELVRIRDYRRMRRSHDKSNHRKLDGSFPFRKLAACIIVTNGESPEREALSQIERAYASAPINLCDEFGRSRGRAGVAIPAPTHKTSLAREHARHPGA
jgi:hypothetical protein